MKGTILTHNCPFACGWARCWHDSPEYLDRIITHPVYGRVTGRQLVQLDISHHHCADYNQWKNVRQPAMLERRKQREQDRNKTAA